MGEQRVSYLSQNDTIMWTVEADPLLRSTIVAIALLDRAPDPAAVERQVRRAIDNVPALRCTVERAPLHPTTLQWVPVDQVDLDAHLRHVELPGPGSFEQLLQLACEAAATDFDRSRPLWEFTVVEGLDDPAVPGAARAAFISKAHHVVTDGIGAVQLAANLFDLVEPAEPAEDGEHGTGGDDSDLPGGRDRVVSIDDVSPPGRLARWRDALAHDVDLVSRRISGPGQSPGQSPVTTLAHTLAPGLVRAVRDPIGLTGDALATARSVARAIAPVFDTASPVMRDRGPDSRYRVLEIPLDDLRAAASAVGVTLNDVFLAGVTGGLRHYHELHDAPVDDLRLAMPISLRTDDDATGGNHVSILRFNVPISISDPVERLGALHEIGQRVRHERSLAHTESIAGALNLLPRVVIGSMLKHIDVVASNVPGTPIPLYLGGSKVVRLVPFGPRAGAAVNLTLLSYCDACCIGIHTDTAAIPDPDEFATALAAGFAEVLALTLAD